MEEVAVIKAEISASSSNASVIARACKKTTVDPMLNYANAFMESSKHLHL